MKHPGCHPSLPVLMSVIVTVAVQALEGCDLSVYRGLAMSRNSAGDVSNAVTLSIQFNMINPSIREQLVIFIGKVTTCSQNRGCSLHPRYNKVLVG